MFLISCLFVQQLDGVNPELREFFNLAGVSEHQLKDDETRDFIYKFIDQHGGVAKAIESIRDAPSLPSNQPVLIAHPAPPLPPSRSHAVVQQHTSSLGYPTKQTSAPKPPPPVPPPPSITSYNHVPSSAPVPPPPPPPPPPMDWSAPPSDWSNAPPAQCHNGRPSMPVKPVPPHPAPSIPASGGPIKNALLEQIRQGAKLKPVDTESDSLKSNNSSGGGSTGDGRDALLNQIKAGVSLKKVETNSERPLSDAGAGGGLAAALAKALQDRTRVMQQTDESSSGSDDSDAPDDEEWDD